MLLTDELHAMRMDGGGRSTSELVEADLSNVLADFGGGMTYDSARGF